MLLWIHMCRLSALRDIITNEYTYHQLSNSTFDVHLHSHPQLPNTQNGWGPFIDCSVDGAPWGCTKQWSCSGPHLTLRNKLGNNHLTPSISKMIMAAHILKAARIRAEEQIQRLHSNAGQPEFRAYKLTQEQSAKAGHPSPILTLLLFKGETLKIP